MSHKIVIVGATSSIAEHCARIWINSAVKELILIGRDINKLKSIEMDLKVRNSNVNVNSIATDMMSPEVIKNVVNRICEINTPDIVLIAHGFLPDQSQCQSDITMVSQTMQINAVSPILWSEAFAAKLEKAGNGKLGVIGSVAGDRARKSNYVYGSAKNLIASYLEGLQHRFAGTNVKVVLIKPGPTATPMTAQIEGMNLADVSVVAKEIVSGIYTGKNQVYTPRKWQLIMTIIKYLPRFIFNKLDI